MAFYSGMALKRLQVLTILVVLAAVSLRLTYGILDEDEYNSIYSEQMREQLNHEVGRFPFLMPNVRPKTVSSVRIPKKKNQKKTQNSPPTLPVVGASMRLPRAWKSLHKIPRNCGRNMAQNSIDFCFV